MPDNTRRHQVLIAGTAIVTAILLSIGAPALADDGGKTDPPPCFIQAETGTTHCFADEAEMEAAMIEIYGSLPLDPDAGFASRSAVAAASSVYIARFYSDASYGGSILPVTAPSSTFCTAGGVAQASSMPSGWNNVISSLRVYNGCVASLYDSTGYGSFLGTYSTSTSNLGSDNDKTSSYQVH
jgi:hypothetical protein